MAGLGMMMTAANARVQRLARFRQGGVTAVSNEAASGALGRWWWQGGCWRHQNQLKLGVSGIEIVPKVASGGNATQK